MVAIRVSRHARDTVADLRDALIELPEVVELFQVSGADDFLVRVAVRDAQHLRDVVLDCIASRPEVRHLETHVLFEHLRAGALPIYTGS